MARKTRTGRKALAVLPLAAALCALAGAPVAHGQELYGETYQMPAPMRAAQLNAGTAWTGIGPSGAVGAGVKAVVPLRTLVAGSDVEVAGVQLSQTADRADTESTLGDPYHASLLNTGTAQTGLGMAGMVGYGVIAVSPEAAEVAGIQLDMGAIAGDLERVQTIYGPDFRFSPE